MDITVRQLERTTADNVVTTVHWDASVTDGDYFASAYGSQSFTRDSDSPELVPFADLTEAKVVKWLTLDSGLEANLLAQIAEQKAPTSKTGLAW
tara:strand:+ start:1104 stop:1385 length:282 start_codon:yes stop_codon:yes gene_type:complete